MNKILKNLGKIEKIASENLNLSYDFITDLLASMEEDDAERTEYKFGAQL